MAKKKRRTRTDSPSGDRSTYRKLPGRVPLKDTTESLKSQPVPDPTMGRDPETEFMLRYSG